MRVLLVQLCQVKYLNCGLLRNAYLGECSSLGSGQSGGVSLCHDCLLTFSLVSVVLLYDLECSFMVKGVQPSICSCHTHD